jgi:hypothetical protein
MDYFNINHILTSKPMYISFLAGKLDIHSIFLTLPNIWAPILNSFASHNYFL